MTTRAKKAIHDAKLLNTAHQQRIERAERVVKAIQSLQGQVLTSAEVIEIIDAAIGRGELDGAELLMILTSYEGFIRSERNRRAGQKGGKQRKLAEPASQRVREARQKLTETKAAAARALDAAILAADRDGWPQGSVKRIARSARISEASVQARRKVLRSKPAWFAK